MQVIYWSHDRDAASGGLTGGTDARGMAGPGAAFAPFRSGEAGCAWFADSGELETDTRVVLSVNSTQALLGHGVVDSLNRVPLDGRLGGGLQVLVPAPSSDAVRSIFYEADRKTYGADYEFVAATRPAPDPLEYRIRIDNREYQRTLSRMQFLITSAQHEGRAVWICI